MAMGKTLRKIDFRKSEPELYRGTKKIVEVRVGKAAYLALDGQGAPGGPEYQDAIGKLFSLAFTAKFALKFAGKLDFAISALECLWYGWEDPNKPMDDWRWRLLIRIPLEVTAADLKGPRAKIKEKKGIDVSAAKRIVWTEGPALQTMHVGPYDAVGPTYAGLFRYAEEHGLECCGAAHEFYLNDPRRVPAAKLKTLVRLPVRRKR
jgi:hypothetical protein